MSCSGCGGVGCGQCLNIGCSPCTNVTPCGTPTPGCASSCQSVLPATPSPFYAAVPSCTENSCQQIITNYYATAICVSYAFNIPACGESASIYFPNVKVLPVGTFLWNSNYGYFEVIAFNHQTGQAVIQNNCYLGNATPGVNVPACTCFIVQAIPTSIDTASDLEAHVSTTKSGAINGAGAGLTTDEIELLFTNTSSSKIMNIVADIIVNASWTLTAGITTLTHSISLNIDGAGYSTIFSRADSVELSINDEMSTQTIYKYTSPLAPGGTRSVKVKGTITNTDGTTNVSVSSLITSASGLGVAV